MTGSFTDTMENSHLQENSARESIVFQIMYAIVHIDYEIRG